MQSDVVYEGRATCQIDLEFGGARLVLNNIEHCALRPPTDNVQRRDQLTGNNRPASEAVASVFEKRCTMVAPTALFGTFGDANKRSENLFGPESPSRIDSKVAPFEIDDTSIVGTNADPVAQFRSIQYITLFDGDTVPLHEGKGGTIQSCCQDFHDPPPSLSTSLSRSLRCETSSRMILASRFLSSRSWSRLA